MIIMLDGPNGVGKTTYAYELGRRLEINVCRVFRSNDKTLHWGNSESELQKELEALEIPINTHIDDIFMADFMRSFQVDAILDRTITSAIAYGRVRGDYGGWYKEKGNSRRLLEFWTTIMGGCKLPIVYVWLDAAYEIAKDRCEGRRIPGKNEYNKLRREYERIFRDIGFRKKRIDTGNVSVEDGMNNAVMGILPQSCWKSYVAKS